MPPHPTKSGTRKLSDLARHVVIPSDITATGWPAVRDKCLDLGVQFDDWQHGLGRAILAKRSDGKYAASVGGVVLSIPRQVGKTFTVGSILFALCILFPGLTVLWTAHRLKTAGETFGSMQGMARRRKIAPFVEQIFTGSGDEEIRFRNGSRILFGARERGFGRGFAEVDVEVFDEAQILGEKALDDMVPATNQSKQPTGALLFFMGTPPKPTDPGEAFTAKRMKALSGKSTDMVYVEFSADRDADPDDRKQWAVANPSYPKRTPVEAMLRMRENLSDDSFLREALGIWDEDGVGPFGEAWTSCAVAPGESKIDRGTVLAAAVSVDRQWACIAAAGLRADGTMHLEPVTHAAGVLWLPGRLKELQDGLRCSVVIDKGGPAAPLIGDIRDKGVTVSEASMQNVLDACASLYDRVQERTVVHMNYPELNRAVAGAVQRTVGDRWAWGRRKSTADITPLEAVTLAAWGVMNAPNYNVLDSFY